MIGVDSFFDAAIVIFPHVIIRAISRAYFAIEVVVFMDIAVRLALDIFFVVIDVVFVPFLKLLGSTLLLV